MLFMICHTFSLIRSLHIYLLILYTHTYPDQNYVFLRVIVGLKNNNFEIRISHIYTIYAETADDEKKFKT